MDDYKDIIKNKRLAKSQQDKEELLANNVNDISNSLKKPIDVVVENIDFNKLSEAIGSLTKVTGAKGIDGKDGKDGYTPVKNVDYFDGIDGKDGIDGIDGVDGYTPIKGIDYFDGKNGTDGKDGKDGKDGSDGKKGDKGDQGERGFPGQNGRNGLNAHEYYLPIAKPDVLGGIKVGSGLSMDEQGVLKTTGSGTGIVETIVAGTNITVDSTDPANPIVSSSAYTLPTASSTVKGGIKIGSRLTMVGDVLSADVQAGGTGDVVGPSSAVDSNFAAFDTTTGKLIKDSGKKATDFQVAGSYEVTSNKENSTIDTSTTKYPTVNLLKTGLDTKVIAPATNTDNYIPQWNGANSKTLKNGLQLTTTAPSSTSTDSQVPSTKSVYDCAELKATQFPGICAETPIGASDISIDYTTRVLTITPPLGYFHYFTDGGGVIVKHVVTGAVSFPAFTDTSGTWNFYFDNAGTATVSQGSIPDFNLVAMVYRVSWNATLTGSAKSVVESIETHENTVAGIDHTWKHKYGTIWVSGGDAVTNALSTGTPNADGRNAVVALTTLNDLDDNLPYTITNSTGGLVWQQDMGNTTAASLNATNSGLFKVRLQSAGGLVSYIAATRFPFAYSAGNVPEYITSTGTRTAVTDKRFFVYYLYALQDPRNGQAIKSVSETVEYTSLTNAQASSWSNIQAVYTTLNDGEIRPLYRLIFEYRAAYDVGSKSSILREVQDLRVTRVTATTATGSVLATSVVNVPAGNIAATNVQDAINELDAEKVPLTKVAVSTAMMTEAATGFTLAGGTTSKTLTVALDASVSGTNTGDQTGGTPALTLGTTNTAGTSTNFIRRDDTILVFDATSPTTQAFGDSAVVGTATVAARRDHKHAMMAAPTTITGNAGTATKLAATKNINGVAFDGSADIVVPSTVFTEVTNASQTAAINNGYICNRGTLVTVTLPSTAAVGSIVEVCGKGAGGWKIAQNASGIIHFGNVNTTSGVSGYIASTATYDAVKLVCTVANNEWVVLSSIGNITIA